MTLSRDQLAAARILSGPVRVVAGPGTGKTAVIAERYRRLVASGVGPDQILVMTFTERAATEMAQRIAGQLGGAAPPNVGTFHSMALRWLREDGREIGIPPAFRIVSGADLWIALRELMWELGDEPLVGQERPDAMVGPLLKAMERLKQELVPLERLEAWCAATEDRERAARLQAAVRLFREHGRRSRAKGHLDFDDLLVEAVRLLESRPAVVARYRRRYRHLMVDEYQDTNLAQERLVELLAAGHRNVFVVGDDDQSIYRFRGASLASMQRFLRFFPDATTVELGRNRRSSRRIVEACARLISRNQGRIAKPLSTTNPAGRPVRVAVAPTGEVEVQTIAAQIGALTGSGGQVPCIGVLCRTNAIARAVVDTLVGAGIPFRQRGAVGLYGMAIVRDAIAMLRGIARPAPVVALMRLVTRFAGLGHLPEAIRLIDGAEGGDPLAVLAGWEPAGKWAPALVEVREMVASAGVADLFFELMSRTRLAELYAADPRSVAAITRLGERIEEFCATSPDQSLGSYLERLDLLLLSGIDDEVGEGDGHEHLGPGVHVMTIHQAKGLEFDVVFVPSLVEGRLPQPHRREEFELPPAVLEPAIRRREDHVAEERRLAYVAMTRARSQVQLSCARWYEGTRAWRESRFLEELGDAVERREIGPPPPDERPAAEAAAAAPAPALGPELPFELSFSALATYRDCPRQHWYRYRLRIPPTLTVEGQYGTLVHGVLMRAGRLRKAGVEIGEDAVRRLLDEAWSAVELVDERRRPVLQRLASSQVLAYVAAGGFAQAPAMLEQPFTTTVDGWRLRGIIDRVDAPVVSPPPTPSGGVVGEQGGSERGAWRIVDYKTGDPLPASRLRRDLQLALYALGARQALGLYPLELEIVYLRTGRRVTLEATDELLDEARRVASEVVAGIRAGRFEPRPERRRCSLCSYRLACDSAL